LKTANFLCNLLKLQYFRSFCTVLHAIFGLVGFAIRRRKMISRTKILVGLSILFVFAAAVCGQVPESTDQNSDLGPQNGNSARIRWEIVLTDQTASRTRIVRLGSSDAAVTPLKRVNPPKPKGTPPPLIEADKSNSAADISNEAFKNSRKQPPDTKPLSVSFLSTPKKPAPVQLAEWDSTWSVTARASASFDSNIEHDRVGVRAYGFIPSLTFGFQARRANNRFRFISSFAAVRHTVDTDLNRNGLFFSAGHRYTFGKLSFETEAEASLGGTNDDRNTNNRYAARETIAYRLNKKTKASAYFAYRLKRFERADARRNSVNPMVGVKFSREIHKRIEWSIGYRYGENRAVSSRQNYLRSSYKTGIEAVLTAYDTIEAEVTFKPRHYRSRLVEVGEREFLRRDKKWTYDVSWERRIDSRFGFEASYQYSTQTSNDPRKEFKSHFILFSFVYHWGNGDRIEP
jgi:hypothetical protein